ncbi:hypothetical protein ACT8ZV_14115 [Nocardioides sp. MAHUQ-72]|uniref:hypothetical protein n=1 Tax=unclassified Nocardioides TaxID=2615069 RepID=UPI00360FE52D
MTFNVEQESGTYAPRSARRHNGYYAGDFSAVPFTPPDLSTLLVLTRAPGATGAISRLSGSPR